MNFNSRDSLLITLACLTLICGSATAQNRVVGVPLFDSSPNGVSAILIHRDRAGLIPEEAPQKQIICRRSDTRASFTAVSQGHFLLITD